MLDARTTAVIAVALAACICDVRTRRLPNALTFGAALAALCFALFQDGLSGLGWSAAGWLTALALFFPFFALRGLGAGDVKLLAALGAWFGASNALYLALYTAVAGGVMAIAVLVSRRYAKQAFWNLWLLLAFWRTNGVRPLPELTLQGGTGPKLAYAIPIAVGALTTLWLNN
jgi:prepilin peptidase CpaA